MLWIPFASSRWSAWHRSHCVCVKGGEDKEMMFIFFVSKNRWARFCRGSSRSSTSSNRWKQSCSCQSGIGSSAKSRGLERTVWDGRKWQHLHLMVPKISPTRKPEDLQGQTVACRHFKTRGNPADFDTGCGTTLQLVRYNMGRVFFHGKGALFTEVLRCGHWTLKSVLTWNQQNGKGLDGYSYTLYTLFWACRTQWIDLVMYRGLRRSWRILTDEARSIIDRINGKRLWNKGS